MPFAVQCKLVRVCTLDVIEKVDDGRAGGSADEGSEANHVVGKTGSGMVRINDCFVLVRLHPPVTQLVRSHQSLNLSCDSLCMVLGAWGCYTGGVVDIKSEENFCG